MKNNKLVLHIEDFTLSHWKTICEELGISTDCETIELTIKSK